MSKYVLLLLAAIGLGFAIYYVKKSTPEDTKSVHALTTASKPVGAVLAGSGVVEPLTQNIGVGTPVPGIVNWVIGYNRLGKPVAVGEALFRLDDRQQRAILEVNKAALASARSQLEKLKQMPRPEEVPPLEARLSEVKVNVADQEDQLGRAQRLYRSRAMSLEEYRRAGFSYEASKEQYRKAAADLQLVKSGAWSADLAVSEAAVKQAEAAVKQAETEIERLEVKAHAAGTLLQINVHPGEFVGSQPGQNLVILGGTDDIHVRVDIDEDDVPLFRPNLPATASLRSDPGQTWPLEFVRVDPFIIPKKSLTRDNTERVDTRVLQVIYKVKSKPDAEHALYIGQQMDVFLEAAAGDPAGGGGGRRPGPPGDPPAHGSGASRPPADRSDE